MKILVATGLFPPEVGGPATYSKLLQDRLPKRGIEVRVLPFSSVRRLPTFLRHAAYFFKALNAARGVDLVYAQDPFSVGLPAILAAKIAGKRFFLKIVGDFAWEQYLQRQGQQFVTLEEFQTRRVGGKTAIQRGVERFVGRHADRVIVPSRYLERIIKAWGVSRERISVIYNSFDVPEILETKQELRARENISGTVLLSAGRMVPWKGFEALISAMPAVAKEIPDAHLYIAGDGPLEAKLRELRRATGNDRVTFLGRLSQAGLCKYVKMADLFVLNTGYEGFSHQLLEVAALGTPILTTPVGGNLELIEDGKTGAIVPYNDRAALASAIIRLCRDAAARQSLAQEARKKVSAFTEEAMLLSLIELFA